MPVFSGPFGKSREPGKVRFYYLIGQGERRSVERQAKLIGRHHFKARRALLSKGHLLEGAGKLLSGNTSQKYAAVEGALRDD